MNIYILDFCTLSRGCFQGAVVNFLVQWMTACFSLQFFNASMFVWSFSVLQDATSILTYFVCRVIVISATSCGTPQSSHLAVLDLTLNRTSNQRWDTAGKWQSWLCMQIAVVAVISGFTCKRGERVNSGLRWPFRLVCMHFLKKEYLTADSTATTAIENFTIYENVQSCLQGIMVVMVDWVFVLMTTTAMAHCRRVS